MEAIKAAAMFSFGIASGWTNENTGIAMIAMIVLFWSMIGSAVIK